MKHPVALALIAVVAGCTQLPRDTEGTLDAIRARGTVRVAVVAGQAEDARVGALLRRLARDTGARPIVRPGAAEPVLAALKAGQVDVVVGPFAKTTPWKSEITLAPPVERVGAEHFVRAAVRNGENQWAMLVERASRETAPELAGEG